MTTVNPSRSTSTIRTTTPSGDMSDAHPPSVEAVPEKREAECHQAWAAASAGPAASARSGASRSAVGLGLELQQQPGMGHDPGVFDDERAEVERQGQRRGAEVPGEKADPRVSAAAPSQAVMAMAVIAPMMNRNARRLFRLACATNQSGSW